ncbi:N-acetylmuramoyl-L-alanine amidase [Lysinibacillus sphaericus]|uniref:N-acetylmuramoyl-L-alanine amidase n=1 Tax=Lysinibacillus sphaericus TaxID=1421 RepID=UPI00190FD2B3|nr:N-acetylmuramoyl-L-alanine amidase [Lysinibacillus sphaericus]QPA56322.1 N-acetylmuramoyl-L-alanine amidase [Lysinibacillus sphaericus]
MTKKFVGSSGHGLKIRGAKHFIDEVDEARKVTNEVHRILTAEYNGCGSVYHDNTSTTQNQNLQAIVNYHNRQQRDIDWSVHFNAASVIDGPRGVEVIYYDTKDLSAKVSAAISKVSGLKDRGAKQRTELYFLKNTNKPAILLEICFVDSKADVELYQKNFKAICAAIAEVLASHLGYTKTQAEQAPKEGQITEAKVMLNDVKTIAAVIIDGRTYAPVRDIADLLGLNLIYNNESKITKLYEIK